MEKESNFKQMSYLDFTKNILKVTLNEDQENLIKLFEEIKREKRLQDSTWGSPTPKNASELFNK